MSSFQLDDFLDALVDNICEPESCLWTGEISDYDGEWIVYPDPELIKEAITGYAKAYYDKKREEADKWISVTEQIPAYLLSVLCISNTGYIHVNYRTEDGDNTPIWAENYDVVYWQYLPDMPKEKEFV